MYTYPGAASVPGPTTSTLAEVLLNGNSTGGTDIFVDASDELVLDTGGISPASIGADGPTVRMRNPDGQWRIQAPVTAAGGQVALEIQDLAAATLWRMISFAAAATVLNEEWRSGGALGNFRVGPDPLFPDSYHGVFAVEDDYVFNTDGADATAYVNFYSGSRVSWGEFSAGRDQELEAVLTVLQYFAAVDPGSGVTERRLTPPAALGGFWTETFGTSAAGKQRGQAIGEPTTITAALPLGAPVQDWDPSGTGSVRYHILRVTLGAPGVLGGLAGGSGGRRVLIVNTDAVVANTLTLNHADAGSLAPNRFLLDGNAALMIPANGSQWLVWDPGSSRWRAP